MYVLAAVDDTMMTARKMLQYSGEILSWWMANLFYLFTVCEQILLQLPSDMIFPFSEVCDTGNHYNLNPIYGFYSV